VPVGALLPYCLAEVAATFLGTITVRAEIIAALVAEICRGLARSAFRRTLIVSGHAEEEDSEGQRPRRALPLSRLLKRLSPAGNRV
jgi:creatinine amidohydrolase/Fe(II)-dependent formamide hydrolase-like protein